MKKRFPAQELLDLGLPHDCSGGEVLEDKLTGASRWSHLHQIVFRLPGQPGGTAWRARYSKAATEQQSERPWEYQSLVDCELVVLRTVTRKEWVPVDPDSPVKGG